MTSEHSKLSTWREQAVSWVMARELQLTGTECRVRPDLHDSEQHAETSDDQPQLQQQCQEETFSFIASVYAVCCQL